MLTAFLIRVIGSFVILRYPILGGFLAIGLDYVDMEIIRFFENGDLSSYQSLDKILDLFYLTMELLVVFSWQNKIAKNSAVVLYLYRFIGIILFEVTQNKLMLVIFPNIFEYFFLIYLILLKLKKDIFFKPVAVFCFIILLAFPKLFHEYLLHINTTHPWTKNKYVSRIIDPDFIETAKTEVKKNYPFKVAF